MGLTLKILLLVPKPTGQLIAVRICSSVEHPPNTNNSMSAVSQLLHLNVDFLDQQNKIKHINNFKKITKTKRTIKKTVTTITSYYWPDFDQRKQHHQQKTTTATAKTTPPLPSFTTTIICLKIWDYPRDIWVYLQGPKNKQKCCILGKISAY